MHRVPQGAASIIRNILDNIRCGHNQKPLKFKWEAISTNDAESFMEIAFHTSHCKEAITTLVFPYFASFYVCKIWGRLTLWKIFNE